MFTRNPFLLHICTSSVCFMSLDGFSFSIVLHLPRPESERTDTAQHDAAKRRGKIHNPLTSCITFIDFHFSCFVPVSSPMNPLLQTQSFFFVRRRSALGCDEHHRMRQKCIMQCLVGKREIHPHGGGSKATLTQFISRRVGKSVSCAWGLRAKD